MAEIETDIGETLGGMILEIPPDFATAIKSGFAVARILPKTDRMQAVDMIVHQITVSGGSVDADLVSTSMPLPRRDVLKLISAVTAVVGLLTEIMASADEFVSAAKGKIFDDDDAEVAQEIAEYVVSQRTELQHSMSRENLANAVLPSLTRFDIAIDLRFKFKENEIEDKVPVAIVNIGTDAKSQSLWLQLSRNDVQRVIEKLQVAEKRMGAVEALVTPGVQGSR